MLFKINNISLTIFGFTKSKGNIKVKNFKPFEDIKSELDKFLGYIITVKRGP